METESSDRNSRQTKVYREVHLGNHSIWSLDYVHFVGFISRAWRVLADLMKVEKIRLFRAAAPVSQPCLSYTSILRYAREIVFKLAHYPQVLANKQATAFLIWGWLIIHELQCISCSIKFGLITFEKLDIGNSRLEWERQRESVIALKFT